MALYHSWKVAQSYVFGVLYFLPTNHSTSTINTHVPTNTEPVMTRYAMKLWLDIFGYLIIIICKIGGFFAVLFVFTAGVHISTE